MPDKSLITEEPFWRFLHLFESLVSPEPLDAFLDEVGIGPQKFVEIRQFLEQLGLEVKHDDLQIYPVKGQHRIRFELSFSEWLAMQTQFSDLDEVTKLQTKPLMKAKLDELLQQNPHTDIHAVLSGQSQKNSLMDGLKGQHGGLLRTLEECAQQKHVCEIKHGEHRCFNLFVHRIVYLDGSLSVVGEDCSDRCLVYMDLGEIQGIKKYSEKDYRPNFSAIEVNDFIFAIRAVSGSEERLVLKIKNQDGLDLSPAYHFLGNPYITSNLEGELIWAASVEPSHELYHWLHGMKDQVEILDPAVIRENFQAYCLSLKEGRKAS